MSRATHLTKNEKHKAIAELRFKCFIILWCLPYGMTSALVFLPALLDIMENCESMRLAFLKHPAMPPSYWI